MLMRRHHAAAAWLVTPGRLAGGLGLATIGILAVLLALWAVRRRPDTPDP